jgi:hypothetical protein
MPLKKGLLISLLLSPFVNLINERIQRELDPFFDAGFFV